MADNKHWALAFEDLKLTDQEQAIASRLVNTPRSRAFLPAAEILKKHGKTNECIELLTTGLEWHPSYSAARVTLAREFFHQGMMEECWELLHYAGDYLSGNFVAQKLRLKTAIVLNLESDARLICGNLVQGGIVDDEVELFYQKLESFHFAAVRSDLLRQLEAGGVKVLPLKAKASGGCVASQDADGIDEGLERSKGFYVAPVKQIFSSAASNETATEIAGCELDTITLAELYEKQGYYGKALEIYRRLACISTQNEMFRRKIAELSVRMNEQRKQDLKVDPKVVEKMRRIEIYDRKIAVLQNLLDRLN